MLNLCSEECVGAGITVARCGLRRYRPVLVGSEKTRGHPTIRMAAVQIDATARL